MIIDKGCSPDSDENEDFAESDGVHTTDDPNEDPPEADE